MRWHLFSHRKNLIPEPGISSKLDDMMHELSQQNIIASQFHAESIILEELRQLNNTSSQIRNEMSNTLYFYLIAVTIIVAGVVGLLSLYYQFKGKLQFTSYTIEFFIMGTFVFAGIVSIMFVKRLLQLTGEQSRCIQAINVLKKFFSERLESQGISKGLFNFEDSLNSSKRIPAYIRYIIIPAGSFFLGAAAYIFSGFISFLLASTFSFPNALAFTISTIFALFVFGICFFILPVVC